MCIRDRLESRLEPSPKGPDRRVYERTKAGREVLHDWLRAGPVVGNDRFAYVGQLIFMGELKDLEGTLEFMVQLREEFDAVLNLLSGAYQEYEELESDRGVSVEEFHEWIAVDMGAHSLRSKVEWCDKSISRIKKRIKRNKQKKK